MPEPLPERCPIRLPLPDSREGLAQALRRAFPLTSSGSFNDLLQAIESSKQDDGGPIAGEKRTRGRGRWKIALLVAAAVLIALLAS